LLNVGGPVFHRVLFILIFVIPCLAAGQTSPDPADSAPRTVIRVTGFTHWAWDPVTRARRASLRAWMKSEDPQTGKTWGQTVRIEPDNPLNFPGFSLKLLNFAAGTGEQVVTTSQGIEQFFQYRDMRFLLPLNPFIWKIRASANGRPIRKADGSWDYETGPDGQRILLWQDWEKIPPVYRGLSKVGDDVFGVPIATSVMGLMYRRDVFMDSGLDDQEPPATWDKMFEDCLQICATAPEGKVRFGIQLNDKVLQLYVLGNGGDFAVPDHSGKGWRATLDTPEVAAAISYGRRLTLTRWLRGPDNKPIVVWDPSATTQPRIFHPALGEGQWQGNPLSNGSSVVFASRTYGPGEINVGVAMNQLGGLSAGVTQKWYDLFFAPEGLLGMSFNTPDRLTGFSAGVNPAWLGYGPIPAGSSGRRLPAQSEMGGLNYVLSNDPQKARLSWEVLSFLAGERARREAVHSYVREGEGVAETLDPRRLEAEGYVTVAQRVQPSLRSYWENAESSTIAPVGAKNFDALLSKYLGPIFRRASEDPGYDFRSALRDAQEQVQARLDFDAGKTDAVKNRGLIMTAISVMFFLVFIGGIFGFRSLLVMHASNAGPERAGMKNRYERMAWTMLAPALLLISVFAYYPIFKALPIAFQDYYVVGSSTWVGANNFVEVFRNPATWKALLLTAYYMGVSVTIGFFAPVGLAILMSEIRWFRYLLRTAYYLPGVVAGIILLVMWQRFYEPTPQGMMNSLLHSFVNFWNAIMPGTTWDLTFQPVDWLRHPVLGIPSVIFVGVWGGMGGGMLIYLAALKSIPEELYEAAEIDGAGWRSRFFHITLAYLKPLLIINFVGAVIGAFQASGNILALAGNFPATYTFAVHLWFEAFGLGNFGVGTALSWLMASILVFFTLWQLNILRKVEFRKAQAD
jgi:ABC-type sugar transport system permease subunit/ABC-type glycerol-3-phosphate transport system substrate-binding protein